jgi:hypothetical protein
MGSMAVEVVPAGGHKWSSSSDRRARCDPDITQRHPRVECRHDERCAQHVGMDDPEAGSLADGADPAVCGAPVAVRLDELPDFDLSAAELATSSATDGVDSRLNWDSVGRPGLDPGTLGLKVPCSSG